MPSPKHSFVHQFVGAVLASLAPVVFIAFLSVPLSLGGHPGEARTASANSQHMT